MSDQDPKVITDTYQEFEDEAGFENIEEGDGPDTDMEATVTPDNGADLEFHIQMRRHTMRDFEGLVIAAAARQIVGTYTDTKLAKAIQDRCAENSSMRGSALPLRASRPKSSTSR